MARPRFDFSRGQAAAALLALSLALAGAACSGSSGHKHKGGTSSTGGGSGAAALTPTHCADGASTPGPAGDANWPAIKAVQVPVNHLPAEFDAPYPQPLANLAWEDGIYISRDGLSLYAFYAPFDLLKAVNDMSPSVDPFQFYRYKRGDLIGQDFSNPVPTDPNEFLHADVACSERASTGDPFPPWTLANLKGQYYNLGAPQGLLNPSDPNLFDYFLFSDDSSGTTRIRFVANAPRDPGGAYQDLSSTITDGVHHQDNPHAERVDPADANRIVLFFESADQPGGTAGNDVWFSITADGGGTWTAPASASSLDALADTTLPIIQPHLFSDGTDWWLYFTAKDPGTGQLSIFRARQGTVDNWNNWQTPQLVVSPGTAAGVGEPTLTAAGDLSFVVVTHNTSSANPYDAFDADPWFLPHK